MPNPTYHGRSSYLVKGRLKEEHVINKSRLQNLDGSQLPINAD